MTTKTSFFGMPLPHFISLFSFVIGVVSIWIHLEIRIAEINVDLANLKQDLVFHKSENRKDFEVLHNDLHTDTKEILQKIDEIQIYLRDKH
jgi:hypothetical protein